ncbi:MAG: O-methyltransferase [Clostridia bacterium]|nr:O-methyltransferase [Clostridia bacterium]
MKEFNYAHNDTSAGERKSVTAKFNRAFVPEQIQKMRQSAFERSIPTADDETLNFLCTLVSAVKPKSILELGTAVGISGAAMLNICADAHLTTVEREEELYKEAVKNFTSLKLENRVTAICGDAGEVIAKIDEKYDFIFLDCAKVQYIKYLPRLKSLLKQGGVLVADDVLLYGWITGEAEIPKKRKMLATHVAEFVEAVTHDKDLTTTILNIGDGVSLSVKL